uniref:Ig-like domain-containing protein n=1 Tax=Vibrio neptunius TaxID=170651 RepID=UPI0005FA18CE
VTGVNVGATSLSAVKNGITSNSVSVDVSDAVITDISVIPSVVHVAKGQHQTLTANAIYSDNTSSEITDSVSWRPVNTSIATVNPEGQVSGVDVGTTTLAAVKDGVTSHSVGVVVSDAVITSISVTPALATIAKGQEKTLTATATYSDNTSTNISNSATWVPIDTSVATITSNAVLSGIKIGTTTLTAVKDGVESHTVDVEVNDAVITDISVTPTTLQVAKGQHQPLTATAIYSDHTSSDVTDSVTWLPVDTSAATVTPEGQVTGVEVGSTTVTAVKDNITSNTIDVDITNAVMTDLTLMPPFIGMPNIELIDTNIQIHDVTAIATYSDGTTANVTDDVKLSLPVDDDTGLVSGAFTLAYNLLIPKNVGTGLLNAHLDGFLRSLDVNVCSPDSIGGDGLARECIFLFKIPNEDGRIFASTPSVDYLDRLGLSRDGDILYTTGKWGHDNDRFYVFTWEQADAMCVRYSGIYLGGRTNWRLIRSDEIDFLHSRQILTQLPNNYYYWTSTKGNKNGEYLGVYMENKSIASYSKESAFLAACVSDRIEE